MAGAVRRIVLALAAAALMAGGMLGWGADQGDATGGQARASLNPIGESRHLAISQRLVELDAGLVKPSPTAAPNSPRYLVIIVLDGARPDYFTVPNMPHVQALIHSGTDYTNAFAGILQSETPSGHASIDTGSVPNHDGIMSFGWVNSDNISVNLFNTDTILKGGMEKIMRQAGAPSIAGLLHRRDPRAKVVALSGYKYYAADAFGGPDADVTMYYGGRPGGKFGPAYVPGHKPPDSILNDPSLLMKSRNYPLSQGDHYAMKLASATLRTMHPQVTLINLPEFDWPLGHVDGANRDWKDVETLMHGFDRDLGMLEDTYRKAGVLDRTLFVLTADHGFAPIDHKVPSSVTNHAIQSTGAEILRSTSHTASYVWIKDKSGAAAAAAAVAHLQNPYIQSVYFKEQDPSGYRYVRASGPGLFYAPGMEAANQYLLSTFDGPNGPDIVIFFREQAVASPPNQESWKGDHGGADWEAQHVPLILSGPGIRAGYESSAPARLMDVAPTALTLMGVPATGMQGIPLADAMTHPTLQQEGAQNAEIKAVSPVVSALQAESAAELAHAQ
jgi:hypothetical protein